MKKTIELISNYKLAGLAIILLMMGFSHPMHVTVTEVEYDKSSQTVEISVHVFVDDLEKHFRLLGEDESLDLMDKKIGPRDELLKKYFKEHIGANINGTKLIPSYLGHEVEGEAIWFFLEISNVKRLKVLEIKNTTLLDLYDDQVNLIHFDYQEEVYSKKLDKSISTARYDLSAL